MPHCIVYCRISLVFLACVRVKGTATDRRSDDFLETSVICKGKVKVKFTLEQALDEDGWSTPRACHFTSGKDPVPII